MGIGCKVKFHCSWLQFNLNFFAKAVGYSCSLNNHYFMVKLGVLMPLLCSAGQCLLNVSHYKIQYIFEMDSRSVIDCN